MFHTVLDEGAGEPAQAVRRAGRGQRGCHVDGSGCWRYDTVSGAGRSRVSSSTYGIGLRKHVVSGPSLCRQCMGDFDVAKNGTLRRRHVVTEGW